MLNIRCIMTHTCKCNITVYFVCSKELVEFTSRLETVKPLEKTNSPKPKKCVNQKIYTTCLCTLHVPF